MMTFDSNKEVVIITSRGVESERQLGIIVLLMAGFSLPVNFFVLAIRWVLGPLNFLLFVFGLMMVAYQQHIWFRYRKQMLGFSAVERMRTGFDIRSNAMLISNSVYFLFRMLAIKQTIYPAAVRYPVAGYY